MPDQTLYDPTTDPAAFDLHDYDGTAAGMLGEDGEQFLALGHGDPDAILEAFRKVARGAGCTEADIATLFDDPDQLKRRYAAFTGSDVYAWWCDYTALEPGPGLVAVTVLELDV